jgi:hypothetical protein
MCDITLNLIDTFKNFYFEVLNCNFYYDKKHKSDEGFIECIISSNLTIKDLNKFKTSLFCVLAKELQFVVNKNVLHLDIEKKDAVQADIDSLYEYIMTTCILKKVSFTDVLKTLSASRKDKELLIQLRNQINKT